MSVVSTYNNATFNKEHCIHFSYEVLTEKNMKTAGC